MMMLIATKFHHQCCVSHRGRECLRTTWRRGCSVGGLFRYKLFDVAHWHKADIPEPPINVRYLGKAGMP